MASPIDPLFFTVLYSAVIPPVGGPLQKSTLFVKKIRKRNYLIYFKNQTVFLFVLMDVTDFNSVFIGAFPEKPCY